MPDYRVYLLDSREKIVTASWITADDAEAASRLARQLFKPGIPSIEIWSGANRLAVLHAGVPDAAT